MELAALILGFALEHFASQKLHLRELRWFDGYFDFGLHRAKRLSSPLPHLVIAALIALPMLPVVFVSVQLGDADIRWDWSYILFALLVVFICLGPRDLGNEVDEYCAALESGDEETASRVLYEISEAEHGEVGDVDLIEEAVFVQAPNRVFGVVFWFMVLGPVGAWLFRVSDLLRRRAVFESSRDPDLERRVLPVIEWLHGVLLWVPVRLAAIGYGLSGSLDDALAGWRQHEAEDSAPLHRRNDLLAASVGKAAMKGTAGEPADGDSAAAARHAMRLVTRTLFIWLIVIAIMTIFGWGAV